MSNQIEAFKAIEDAKLKIGDYNNSLFIGTLLELQYQNAELATCDAYQEIVGGLPQGAFVAIYPTAFHVPETPYFILGRIEEVSATPLSKENLQTSFELAKRDNPNIDDFTRSDLSWSARRVKLVGTYYSRNGEVYFAGDVANVSSPQSYRVYVPSQDLLELIINGLSAGNRYPIGNYRPTECLFSEAQTTTSVSINTDDLLGRRTVAFGQTRCGKSSALKVIAQATIDGYKGASIGQLIFDANGEYANSNPQDGNSCLRENNPTACEVFAITQRPGTPSHPLRMNFYTSPEQVLPVIRALAEKNGRPHAAYFQSFLQVQVPSLNELYALPPGSDRFHGLRIIQLLWAALSKAGYPCDESALLAARLGASRNANSFNPGFNKELRAAIYGDTVPASPSSLSEMVAEWDKVIALFKNNPAHAALRNKQGDCIFCADEKAMLSFLEDHGARASCTLLRAYIPYHDAAANDYLAQILTALDDGKTVILDMGNAPESLRHFFSDEICKNVFAHQEGLFASNALGNRYIQIFFEEAHNLLPSSANDLDNIYAKLFKEGAKSHIGIVFSTQSPTSISPPLLSQCENFMVTHLASQIEADALAKLSVAFDGLQPFLLNCRTPGLMLLLTISQRYAIPVQFRAFKDLLHKEEVA